MIKEKERPAIRIDTGPGNEIKTIYPKDASFFQTGNARRWLESLATMGMVRIVRNQHAQVNHPLITHLEEVTAQMASRAAALSLERELEYQEKTLLENPRIRKLKGEIDQAVYEASQLWKSPKARHNEIVARITPPELLIPRWIINAGDKESLEECILSAVQQGYCLGIRTSDRKILNTPWVMGIDNEEKAQLFLENEYPYWLKTLKALEALVIMGNPPGLAPENDPQHFVLAMQLFPQRGVQAVLRPGITQLRALDRDDAYDDQSPEVHPKHLINLEMLVELGKPYQREKVQSDFGHHYYQDSRPKADIVSLTALVEEKIFGEWLGPPHNLFDLLCALSTTTIDPESKLFRGIDIPIIEFQGKTNINEQDMPVDIAWMLIYDVKSSRA